MSWNYRLIRHKYPSSTIYESEQCIDIMEVYYDENGKIVLLGEAPVPYGETVEDAKKCYDLLGEAFKQPALDYDEISKEWKK